MLSRWRVGESMGPYVVESVELTETSGGEWTEHVVNSGRTVLTITHRPVEKPRVFLLPKIETETQYVIPFVPQYKNEYARNPMTTTGAPKDAVWVDVSGSPWNYWSLMKTAWDPAHNLFLIEHDVQSTQAQRDDIEACPELWCINQYHHFSEVDRDAWKWGLLGHTRFRKELIAKFPHMMQNLDERWRDWHEMSTGIGMFLREAGYAPHEHLPYVYHHRMDASRGA